MALKTGVAVEEYLRTTFEGPDREYLDGAVVERNMGDGPHSGAQTRLIEIFYEIRKRCPLLARAELRFRRSANRFLIPDVAVFRDQVPAERIPAEPPFAAIEILSAEDRYGEVMAKLAEYSQWGVAHVWLVDPNRGKLYRYVTAGVTEVEAFEIPEFDCRIQAGEIFAV
ncbi:MAG: Uma2 family endonuclease [Bryobacteraceae bacterium]